MRNVKSIFVLASMLICMGLAAKATAQSSNYNNSYVFAAQADNKAEISLDAIKEIGELAALKCYYNNVAKSEKKPESGLAHLGEKSRSFWIEYTGSVEIGYDVSGISMSVKDNTVTISLPEPKITCDLDEDSWDEDSYIIEKDQFFQKNPITAKDQVKAINNAQKHMEKTLRENSSLLKAAEKQAKILIKNYIKRVGEASGFEYAVEWENK